MWVENFTAVLRTVSTILVIFSFLQVGVTQRGVFQNYKAQAVFPSGSHINACSQAIMVMGL
jgi:hypothetical protein